MGLDQAIARFRRKQRALFRDSGRVERPTGTSSFNKVSGTETPNPPTLIYEGPLQVRPATRRSGRDLQVGETEVRASDFELKLPVNTAVRENDVMTVTASRFDAGLVGRTFRITDVLRDGRQVARVAVLEEVSG